MNIIEKMSRIISKWRTDESGPFSIPPRSTYEMGGGWGDRIEWLDWDNRKVVGWKKEAPQVGDRLVATMKSGKKAAFRFVTVEPKSDPPDMFSAIVADEGYLENLERLWPMRVTWRI